MLRRISVASGSLVELLVTYLLESCLQHRWSPYVSNSDLIVKLSDVIVLFVYIWYSDLKELV